MPESMGGTPDNAVLGVRVSNLESAVGGLKSDVAQLSHTLAGSHQELMSKISEIGTSFVAARNPDWKMLLGVATLAVAVIGACATLAKAPIDATLIRLETDTREINRMIVPRAEHEQRWRVTDGAIASLRTSIEEIRRDLYLPKAERK